MASQAQVQVKRGGKRAKKQANHPAERDTTLLVKEDDQEYAKITKVLGNCRFTCECYDGKVRLGILRGRLTKGKNKHENLVAQDDYVLVTLRAFEKDKCDIIIKYKPEQVRKLIQRGELPANATVPVRIGEELTEDDNMPFSFEDI